MYKQLYNLDAEGNEIKTYALGGDDFSQFDDLLDSRASGKRALDIAHDQAFMARVASLEPLGAKYDVNSRILPETGDYMKIEKDARKEAEKEYKDAIAKESKDQERAEE